MGKRNKRGKHSVHNMNIEGTNTKSVSKSKLQLFLERKKIYFETIMMLAVSIAGIIVSIVSVNVAIVANDISLDEKRIADLEKQPSFIFDLEADEDKVKYLIRNVGGDIKYGNVFGDEVLIVAIYDGNYDYLGKGYVFLGGYLEQDFSTYDFDTKCFELYSTLETKPVTEWVDKIQNLIINEGFYCGIECTKYFDFIYTDYKQETVQKTMILRSGIINNIENTGDYEFRIRVSLDNLDDEQIADEIKRELGLLVRYNSK